MTDTIQKTFTDVADALAKEHADELHDIEADALALLAETKKGSDDVKRASILDRLLKRSA